MEGHRGANLSVPRYSTLCILYKIIPARIISAIRWFLMLFLLLEFGEACKLIRCIRAGIMSPCRMIHKESSKLALLGIEFKARTCYSHINRCFHGA